MALHLFIDANVFLSFYHLTSDDLEELEKLAVLIESKEIVLYLTQQIIDEIRRNRENKIKGGFDGFRKQKISIPYPAYCKQYDEYKEMRQNIRNFENNHATIIKKIQKDIENESLFADLTIKRLFGLGETVPRTDIITQRAQQRMDFGNPPGKKGSLGDAINWESLLEAAPAHLRFYIVADDSDFSSALDPERISTFLRDEWGSKKRGGEILFYRKLSDFFKENYPNINLEEEAEKDSLIDALAASGSFARTHALVASLSKYDAFTRKQSEDLMNIFLLNEQVHWIAGDSDVHAFFSRVYEGQAFGAFGEYPSVAMILNPTHETVDLDDEVPF